MICHRAQKVQIFTVPLDSRFEEPDGSQGTHWIVHSPMGRVGVLSPEAWMLVGLLVNVTWSASEMLRALP